jgi:hypothetical protein
MTGLIGPTWKSRKVWSGRVLTAENLTFYLHCPNGSERDKPIRSARDIHAHYAILRQHVSGIEARFRAGFLMTVWSHGFVWW